MTMLETDRLIVRPFRESDYKDLYEYLSLEETYQYEPGEPVSLEEAREYALKRSNSVNWWAVTLKDDIKDKLIGHISLFQTDMEIFKTWEIGYIFNPDYHNQGYATEACQAVINYAFTQLNAHRIVANCSPANRASWRVLEKCGLTREATRRKNAFFRTDDNGDPIWFDSFEYAILDTDER
ncbi:MAG: GNAT family N-acetyltransferase [Dehalococcoidales bacterium]|nr:MAG: GNAT family N-acetyltransferase [Dehalococcoidales bacterium]